MKKINGGYKSLFEYLTTKEIDVFMWIRDKFYKEDHDRYNETPRGEKTDQLIGSLQPFADMAHDFQYTVKRYRELRDFFVDLFQPLRGLRNILQGLAFLVGTLIYSVGAVLSNVFRGEFKELRDDLVRILSWLIDGGARIIRGLTQILATPLTWFLKIPLRIIITFVKGTPNVLENEDIKRLYQLSQNPSSTSNDGFVSSLSLIQDVLYREYDTHVKRGQKTTVEIPKYSGEADADKIREYLQQFQFPPINNNNIPSTPDFNTIGVSFPDMDPWNKLSSY